MKLRIAEVGKEYIIQDIITDDEILGLREEINNCIAEHYKK